MAKLLKSAFAVAWLGACVSGCSQGSYQWYEKANPCTEVRINPLTRTVSLFTNDGRGMTLQTAEVAKTADGWSFKVEGLAITERSVENRAASVEQDRAMGEVLERVAKANWEGATGLVKSIVDPIMAVLPELTWLKETGKLDALVRLAEQAPALLDAANRLRGPPTPGGPTP